jgi:hypothetical protein
MTKFQKIAAVLSIIASVFSIYAAVKKYQRANS